MAKSDKKRLAGYEILLCLTGGIACYKSADLASKLVQAGAGVNVAMSDSAEKFIAPLTLQTLTARQVYTSLWQSMANYQSHHIALTELADLMVVAPATANIIAKTACGIADELVCCLALSAMGACPILIAPAMNTRMWNAPATQANVSRLKSWGVHFVGPETGRLACDTIGPGRMAEPEDIMAAIRKIILAKPAKKAAR